MKWYLLPVAMMVTFVIIAVTLCLAKNIIHVILFLTREPSFTIIMVNDGSL